MGPDVVPHLKQDALALMLTRTVLVWSTEVACGDGAIDGAHDLRERDLDGGARQHVATTDAALGQHQARALEREEDLFEVWLRQAGPVGDVPDRGGRTTVGVEGERKQRPAGVVATRRDLHDRTRTEWTLTARIVCGAGWQDAIVTDVDPAVPPITETPVAAAQPMPSGPELTSAVEEPAKVLRIGSMVKQLLEEVKAAPLDDASRHRLREVYEISVRELASGLSPDLRDELARLVSPFSSDAPSDAELRVAHAQLVGWLEGLFHGMQAMLFAQQAMARQQMDQMRQRALPAPAEAASGTYL